MCVFGITVLPQSQAAQYLKVTYLKSRSTSCALTACVEPSGADGSQSLDEGERVEHGQADQERQRSHGPHRVHRRSRARADPAEHPVHGNAAIPRK